ncbi:SusD/RagB family nutrient-binding outer membrane lipoprotein [Bacteroidota bacterium]
MKTLRYIYKISVVLAIAIMVNACSGDWLDVNTDPNNPAEASLDLLLPAAQVSMALRMTRTSQQNGSIFTRQYYNLSESQYTHTGSDYANDFDGFFSGALTDLERIIDQGTVEERYHFIGIAQVCKAYIYMIMVDLWGDLPYDEALKGSEYITPKYQDDEEVYNRVLTLLDDALVSLDEDDIPVAGDLVYDGDIDLWIKAANTIRFRMYLNMENATGMTQMINDDEMISDNEEDFQFQFGPGIAPQNRHPLHQREYVGGNKIHYMDNYFMYNMLMKDDPRTKYYLYRQDDGSSLTFETIPCNTRTDCIYGYLGTNPDLAGHPDAEGYIGRDHGDPSGLPGDNTIRTTFGIYPIGGRYDDGSFDDMDDTEGTGEGIIPFLTFSMVKFMHAEGVLRFGLAGDASALMREGIVASMEKVSDFATTLDQDAPPIDDADISAYADSRVLDLALAANPTAELNVVIKEKYYAVWGNGIEAYTDYRRTGCPLDLPTSLVPAAPYPLRLHYSVNEQASNPNTPEPAITDPIFWDKN